MSNFVQKTRSGWHFCLVLFVALLLPLISVTKNAEAASTPTGDPISDTLCKISTMLTGKAGKAVATVGVVALGIGLFLGKLSWGLAVATAIGIGLIFGSSQLIGWISSNGSAATSCSIELRYNEPNTTDNLVS